MRITSTVLTLMFVAVAGFGAQEQQSPSQTKPVVKRVRVSSKTVAALPKSERYVLDLTKTETVYDVSRAMDYSRVSLRTEKGEMPLKEEVARMNLTHTRFLVGAAADLEAIDFGFPPSGSGTTTIAMTCNGLICGCTGKKACGDMRKHFGDKAQFYCGTASAGGTNMASYGRKPGTYGCVTAQPQ